MAKRKNPEIQTRKGLPRQKQTITIEKLNTIINMMPNFSIQQIQRAIGIGKTAINK